MIIINHNLLKGGPLTQLHVAMFTHPSEAYSKEYHLRLVQIKLMTFISLRINVVSSKTGNMHYIQG